MDLSAIAQLLTSLPNALQGSVVALKQQEQAVQQEIAALAAATSGSSVQAAPPPGVGTLVDISA